MAETLYFERKVDPRYEGEDLRIENVGVNKFRLYTGENSDFDFDNRMKQERFDANFISALNEALDDEHQLDVRDRDVERAMNDLRRSLEQGSNVIQFRITFRMQN